MRTPNLAAASFGLLLAGTVFCGLWTAPAATAAPAGTAQNQSVQMVQFRHPYYHHGAPYWHHQWWRHRYWRHHHWYYYD